MSTPAQGPYVWDWPLRLFHWLLVLVLLGSWATAELGIEYRDYHMRCGYAVIGLLVFRLCWAVLGSRHARFAALVPRPGQIVRHLRRLPDRSTPQLPGHNPLGVMAIWAMFTLLALQTGTGLFADDDIAYVGPYQGTVSGALSQRLTDLHHANFDWLLGLIGLHLLAIGFYSLYKRQNLIMPMIDGRQRLTGTAPGAVADTPIGCVAAGPAAAAPGLWRVLLAITLSALSVMALLYFAPAPVYDYFY